VADLVLDTHATIFALGAAHKLGRGARAAMRRVETGRDQAWIPAAVVAEVILLRQLARSAVGVAEIKAATQRAPGLRFLPLDMGQLDEFAALASIRDPFDRLIVAAARAVGAKLVTKDQVLTDLGLVPVVW
jgi:PIN domain nuclease of toxin-antitoxin system